MIDINSIKLGMGPDKYRAGLSKKEDEKNNQISVDDVENDDDEDDYNKAKESVPEPKFLKGNGV